MADELKDKHDDRIEHKCTGQYGRRVEDEEDTQPIVGWWGAEDDEEYEPL